MYYVGNAPTIVYFLGNINIYIYILYLSNNLHFQYSTKCFWRKQASEQYYDLDKSFFSMPITISTTYKFPTEHFLRLWLNIFLTYYNSIKIQYFNNNRYIVEKNVVPNEYNFPTLCTHPICSFWIELSIFFIEFKFKAYSRRYTLKLLYIIQQNNFLRFFTVYLFFKFKNIVYLHSLVALSVFLTFKTIFSFFVTIIFLCWSYHS